MEGDDVAYVDDYFDESIAILRAAAADIALKRMIVRIAALVSESLRTGGKALFIGNGGSAGDAQHMAGEFVSRLNFDRAPLAGLALTTDTSVLTAIGNDYGYVEVFSRQVAAMGRPGDVLIAITTSGNSPNVLAAVDTARAMGISTVGLTGREGGQLTDRCDLCLHVPSNSTPHIQQVHIIAGHAICALVERAHFGTRDRAKQDTLV